MFVIPSLRLLTLMYVCTSGIALKIVIPDTLLSGSHALPYLLMARTPSGRYYDYPL